VEQLPPYGNNSYAIALKKFRQKCNSHYFLPSLKQTIHLLSHQNENIDALLQQCLEGKQRAQMEIYNRYYKAMYNTALRIVKHTAEAEDVMQESFLNAFTKLNTFKGDVTFGAWLKRIVINNSIYHYRKQQKNQTTDLDDVMYKVEDNNEVALDRSGYMELKAQKVMQTMKSLKDNYRVSLTLHLIEGYDYEEMSEIMDISYANCRTTVSRAKESLRKKLAVNI
jgi:RNA polymerase sigma-70 factor (ECF subfamily)